MVKGKKRVRPADGDFWAFKVTGGFGFLRVRRAISAVCAVYGRIFPSIDVPLSEIAAAPVAFNVKSDLGMSGDFSRVGNEPLPAELREPVWFWRRIVGNADQVTLDSSTGDSKRVPISEANGLEKNGGYTDADIANRLIAWTENRDTTMADNERELREKPWMRGPV